MNILVFAPHAAIWVHAFPETLVAEALQQKGHDITYVTCGNSFERYCVAMSAYGLGFDSSREARLEVCDQCARNGEILRSGFGLVGPELRNLVTTAELADVENIIARLDRTSVLDFERDNIPLGRVALYQLIIRKKILHLNLSDEDWREYRVELRHTLLAWSAMRRLLETHRPDRVIVYNGLYSVNRAACLTAEARGIPAYFLHAGGNLANRLHTLMVGRGDTFGYYDELLRQWPRFCEIPCTSRMLSLVTDHYEALFGAQNIFVYSKKRSTQRFDMREHFGISPAQKIMVATLSSYDEELAAELVGARSFSKPRLYATQVDWIKALIKFAVANQHLFLVIRVHPREFSNDREAVTSEHASILRKALSDVPENVAVNWPSDNISLYDLADQTDVFLNSWSSVGKEMALLGIPVVLYSDELPLYPASLNYFGETESTYFSAIEQALISGWSAEGVRSSYRWAAYEFIRSTVDISDSYSHIETRRNALPTRVADRVRRTLDPDFRQRRDLRNRSQKLKAAGRIAEIIEGEAATPVSSTELDEIESATRSQETAALRGEMKRLGDALFPTPEAQRQSRLYAHLNNPLFR